MDTKDIQYTFIIPHKNCPDLLTRCVESIPERDDIQIVVVDDNSDVDKKPILTRDGVEVVLLDAEHSNGAGRARNIGLKHANGKWLLFADADDYYKDGFLKVLDEYKDQQIDVLYFNHEYRNGKTGELLPPLPYSDYYKEYDETKYTLDQIKYRVKVPWNKMVLRDFVLKNDISFEEALNGNDIFFSMCVGYYAKEILIDKRPVYVYLKNENSLVNTKKKSKQSYLCQIKHRIQLNKFYIFIGYPEWQSSVIRRTMSQIKEYGPQLFFYMLSHANDIIESRNNWVNYFKSKTK